MIDHDDTSPDDDTNRAPPRSTIFVAPDGAAPEVLTGIAGLPHYCSTIDAQSVIAKLSTFTPSMDFRLAQAGSTSDATLWQCPTGLMHHLSKIDVLSTSAFLSDWNSRTGFINFADSATSIGDLIFQMKQLAAIALRRGERLYLHIVVPAAAA
jgi:hypothetical protein